MKQAVFAIMFLALASCTTAAEREAQQERAWAAQQAADEANCQSYGFTSGTPDFSRCMEQASEIRSQARAWGQQQLQNSLIMQMMQPRQFQSAPGY